MGANRYMVDSGGFTRHIRKRFAVDAGGVVRQIRKRYIIDAGGTARLTFLFADVFNGISGANSSFGTGFFATLFGTINGSVAPFPLNGGSQLFSIYNKTGNVGAILQVQNLGANPGSGWLIYIMINGNKKFPTDAGTIYSFSAGGGGTATWNWNTPFTPFLSSGLSFPGELSHN